MLDISAESMWRELNEAENQRDKILSDEWTALCEQLTPKARALDGEWIEKAAFEYLSLMVPRVVIQNPRVSVTSHKETSESVLRQLEQTLAQAVMEGRLLPQEAQVIWEDAINDGDEAKALEHGENRWIRDSDYHLILDAACYDSLLGFAVLLSTRGIMPGEDPRDPEALRWPETQRLSPKRYLQDSKALMHRDARWQSHWEERDKDDLLKEAENAPEAEGWDIAAIKDLEPDPDNLLDPAAVELQRKEVIVHSIWVREYTEPGWPGPKEGFHGALLTMAGAKGKVGDTKHGYIRKPRPYYGPRWGPYTLIGVYRKPDSPYPLSPLLATFTQQKELNAHVNAMSIAAAQYKKILIVSDANEDLAEKIKDTPNAFVVTADFLSKDEILEVEVGGISEQQLTHFAMFKARLEETLGLTQAQKGRPGGQGSTGQGQDNKGNITATADAIADNASEVRVSYIKHKFNAGVRQDLKTKAWYLWNDEQMRFPLGVEASEAFDMVNPVFQGGMDEKSASFDDLELEIDAYSMERTSEALLQKRMMEAWSLIMAAAPVMVELPWVKWKEMIRKIGDALNLPDLVNIIDFEMIEQMAQMAQEQQQMEEQMGASEEQRTQETHEAEEKRTQEAHEKAMKEPIGAGGSKPAKPKKRQPKPARSHANERASEEKKARAT